MTQQPFPKTWWVQDGQFLAGCFPGTPGPAGVAERLSSLVAAGIRTFVSLQEADECNTRTGVPFPHYEPVLEELSARVGEPLQFHRFPIADCTAPTAALAALALNAIDASLAGGRPVYLHCWGGHGRTGTIVGCWLVRHGATGPDALLAIRRLRSRYPELASEPAPQVRSQCDLVRKWRAEL